MCHICLKYKKAKENKEPITLGSLCGKDLYAYTTYPYYTGCWYASKTVVEEVSDILSSLLDKIKRDPYAVATSPANVVLVKDLDNTYYLVFKTDGTRIRTIHRVIAASKVTTPGLKAVAFDCGSSGGEVLIYHYLIKE